MDDVCSMRHCRFPATGNSYAAGSTISCPTRALMKDMSPVHRPSLVFKVCRGDTKGAQAPCVETETEMGTEMGMRWGWSGDGDGDGGWY